MIEGRDISYGVKLYLSSKLVPAGLLWIGGMVGPYWLLDCSKSWNGWHCGAQGWYWVFKQSHGQGSASTPMILHRNNEI